MDIKLKTPRHIHKPVDSVTVDSYVYIPHTKTLRYSAMPSGDAGPMRGINREIKVSDELAAALDKLVADDAASIGE